MQVTEFQYNLENKLLKKLDLMIDRCTRDRPVRDSWLINEGGEGEGKTNSSVAEAYYIKHKTGRDIHLWFRLRPMIDFAKNTAKKIIIWDEPAFDSLKSDSQTTLNKDLIRLLSTCRKKQHFLIINMTRFYRFNEAIVVDRCLGLVHMYSKNEIEPGRFVYIKKNRLESLYNDWNKKHIRSYKQLKTFHGRFPEVMNRYFDKMGIFVEGKPNATLQDYEMAKDKAIQSIGEAGEVVSKKEIMLQKKLDELRAKVTTLWKDGWFNQNQLAKKLGVTPKTLQLWDNSVENVQIPKENKVLKAENSLNMHSNGHTMVESDPPTEEANPQINQWPIYAIKKPPKLLIA